MYMPELQKKREGKGTEGREPERRNRREREREKKRELEKIFVALFIDISIFAMLFIELTSYFCYVTS